MAKPDAHPFDHIDSTWRHTPLWRALKDHLEARIEEHRDTLERATDDRKVARAQARIAEDRYLLGLGEEKILPELDTGISEAGY